jgi:hypothetical protein
MDKLIAKGFETSMTPFGYLFEFKIHVKGIAGKGMEVNMILKWIKIL